MPQGKIKESGQKQIQISEKEFCINCYVNRTAWPGVQQKVDSKQITLTCEINKAICEHSPLDREPGLYKTIFHWTILEIKSMYS